MSQPIAAGRVPVELLPPITDPLCECGHLLSEHEKDSDAALVCVVKGDGFLGHWADDCCEFVELRAVPPPDYTDGTGGDFDRRMAVLYRWRCTEARAAGVVTWADVLRAEFGEVLAAADPDQLAAALARLAAVAADWTHVIARRGPRDA